MTSPSSNTQTLTDALAGITGPEHIRHTDEAIVIAPANTGEVAEVLRFANANHCSVAPRGGGTKQGWGNPLSPAILLDTHRFHTVREHTWQDMTCTVEAGCTWSSLQAILAQHGQHVALDPLWPQRATVGGVVATNDSGALRLRYGGLRDLIIGMTIVLADGTVAHTGGKVVKNVAGYDLHKLMIGALGTLGVITSVNFRLHSIPQSVQTFSIGAPSAEPLGKLMMALLHGQLSTVAMQLRGDEAGFSLDIQLASLAEVLSTQAAELHKLAGGLLVVNVPDDVWSSRERVMTEALVCKCTMLPSQVAQFAERIRGLGGKSATQATGIMLAGFPVSVAERLPGLRSELEAIGGSVTVLKQPEAANLNCWGALPDSFPLMRELKRQFDPERILNPGRFLGGI